MRLRSFDASLDLQDQAAAEMLEIGRSDLRALEVVSRAGIIGASQLARELRLSPGAITGLVRRMEKLGLLERVPDMDRRKALVRLSRKGRRREASAFQPVSNAWLRTLKGYDPDELRLIADFLTKGQAVVDRNLRRLRRR